jgi:hypothetical protein
VSAIEAVVMPAGVTDADWKTGYVANATNGVNAIELKTGRVLWTNADAAVPLLAEKNVLYALTSDEKPRTVRVVSIDASGNVVFRSDEIVLPHDGRVFRRVALDGRTLWLEWESFNAPNPGPRMSDEYNRSIGGAARVDLDSGGTQMVEANAVPRPAQVQWPAEALNLTLWTDSLGKAEPWLAGDRIAALELKVDNDGLSMLLRTWNAANGAALKTKSLLERAPAGGYTIPHVSLDRLHVIVLLCNDRERDGRPPGAVCNWRIYKVASGSLVGELEFERGTETPFAVHDGAALYVRQTEQPVPASEGKAGMTLPRTLKAVQCKSRKIRWEHAVKATAMRAG